MDIPQSDAFVFFGATGDLAFKKIFPALQAMIKHGHLDVPVIGVARSARNVDELRARVRTSLEEHGGLDAAAFDKLSSLLRYVQGDNSDPATHQALRLALAGAKHPIFYLAIPPTNFGVVVEQLGKSGCSNGARVIVEKPFGRDYDSARALNKEIRQVLDEKQIYRIDHYLGKETVQNILVFRFSNGIFEPIWNRRYIDHIQITVAETVGVEQRGMYYDKAGTLRDMVPNHIFQLISLTAMEPPVSFDADVVRDEQAKILKALTPMTDEEVLTRTVRGQYGEGLVKGAKIAPYRSEPMVAPDSRTETFVAMKLFIDNWRWADVPFYLRTGKSLPKRATEISIQFKRAPFMLFRRTAVDRLEPNRLVLHLQPDEGISLSFGAKIPGPVVQIGGVNMNFNYGDYFNATPQTGYERLLYDCMLGDATLFQRSDMVEAAWHVVAPILDVWEALPPRRFPNYGAGTWGPPEAEELLSKDRRHWSLCE